MLAICIVSACCTATSNSGVQFMQACIAVCPKNPASFNVDNVRVVKIPGGGVNDSAVVRGMVSCRLVQICGLTTIALKCACGTHHCSPVVLCQSITVQRTRFASPGAEA